MPGFEQGQTEGSYRMTLYVLTHSAPSLLKSHTSKDTLAAASAYRFLSCFSSPGQERFDNALQTADPHDPPPAPFPPHPTLDGSPQSCGAAPSAAQSNQCHDCTSKGC